MKSLTGSTARIIFAIPFGLFGVMHFMKTDMFAGMVPSFVPGGVFWVYLIGLALLAATAAIISGKMAREAALGLAALMLVFILTIWLPKLMGAPDAAAMGMALGSLFKEIGLMAGALVVGLIFFGQACILWPHDLASSW
jgi:uncharacterized membrane protein